MLGLFLFLSAASPAVVQPPPSAPRCDYDSSILSLGFDAFDQDMHGGWRALADRPGCGRKAADVVKSYREKYESLMPILYWHEAQLRASSGDYRAAIPLMMKSRIWDGDLSGWAPYVDATLAFLRRDKAALLKARRRLAAWPKPKDWPADAEWPENFDIVNGLVACFGKSYAIASGKDCRTKSR